MKRMMASITNINSNSTELCFKDWMSRFSFHIVAWFVEITYSRNMTFLLFSKYISVIIDNDSCIMDGFLIFFSFKDRRYNNHIVFSSEITQKLSGFSIDSLWEFDPRISLSGTHKEWSSPYLLKPNNIHFFKGSNLNNLFYPIHNCFFLLLNGSISRQNNFILNSSNFHKSLRSNLLFFTNNLEIFYF